MYSGGFHESQERGKMKMIRNEKGGSLVEFVIIAPLLFIILFGIIESGLLLYNKAVITNASREGARAGIVFDYDSATGLNHPDDDVIRSAINNYCQNYLITFGSGGTPVIPNPTREGDGAGDSLTIRVEFQYDFLVLPGFIAALTDGINLTAETVMRME